jgi:multidrug efflux pump subunit AcrB
MTVDRTEGVIAWFARNSVAANLVLLTIVAAGLLTLVSGIKVEVFPEVEPELVTVSVVYPGATPAEVEEGVCVRVEEAVETLDGIKRVTLSAAEGAGAATS